MTLSIIIPTYNYDCSKLIRDLHAQFIVTSNEVEIIVCNDASTDTIALGKVKEAEKEALCQVLDLEHMGRARAIAYAAERAKGEWMLIIDADASVISNDFATTYIASTNQGYDVICGGLKHADRLPSPTVALRYKYEKRADRHRSAEERNRNPYDKFTTFSVMMKREVFTTIGFNRACTEYGYEDALFGRELEKRGIGVLHIDNPLQHDGLDTSEAFLEKVETAQKVLSRIAPEDKRHMRVDKTYRRLCSLKIISFYNLFFCLTKEIILSNLKSGNPSLTLLNIYKVGFYAELMKSSNNK